MTPAPALELVRAAWDPTLVAELRDPSPLRFSEGALPEQDLPAHVRAASAVRRVGGRLFIVQDDVSALVLHDVGGATRAVPLPAGPGGARSFDDGRGNKHAKLDLEACAALPDGRLVAFGSGSTRVRERLIVFDATGAHRTVDAAALYTHLRHQTDFAGSELNVEGAVVVGPVLRLFQRGNGAARGDLQPVNATGDLDLAEFLDWLDGAERPPALRHVVQYDLGLVEGVSLTFTDAALVSEGRVAFLACAEASPDAVRDGEVVGCAFGLIEDGGARVAPILDAGGGPTRKKLEGIEPHPGSDSTFDVVADLDQPDEPALLCRLIVRVC